MSWKMWQKNLRTVLWTVNIFAEWEAGASDWDRVDYCSANKLKSSHPTLNREKEANCGLFERLPRTLGPKVKFNILPRKLWLLWVTTKAVKLYSSVFKSQWLHCDDSHSAIVSPKPSPWERLAVHESLCIAGNMRGFRGRSHPQSLLWHS